MRVVNRPLAFILAAALGVAAVIVIIEVIAVAAHHGPVVVPWTTWYRWANRTRWDQLVIQIWSGHLDRDRRGDCSPWSSSPLASPGCRCGRSMTPLTPR